MFPLNVSFRSITTSVELNPKAENPPIDQKARLQKWNVDGNVNMNVDVNVNVNVDMNVNVNVDVNVDVNVNVNVDVNANVDVNVDVACLQK